MKKGALASVTVKICILLMNCVFLVLTFAATDTLNYYFDSSFRALVKGGRVFFCICIFFDVISLVADLAQKEKPKAIRKCPHCGASVSNFSEVCWRCHISLRESPIQAYAPAPSAPKKEAAVVPPEKTEESKNEPEGISQEYDVFFTGLFLPSGKIKVIGVVREIVGLGLADAKEFVENPPCLLKSAVSLGEAEQIKGLLESLGATVEIKAKE